MKLLNCIFEKLRLTALQVIVHTKVSYLYKTVILHKLTVDDTDHAKHNVLNANIISLFVRNSMITAVKTSGYCY